TAGALGRSGKGSGIEVCRGGPAARSNDPGNHPSRLFNAPPIIPAIEPEGAFGGAAWKKIAGGFSRNPASWLLAHSQSGPWQLRPARPRLLPRRPRKS